jgi:signal transduction histidine kinase
MALSVSVSPSSLSTEVRDHVTRIAREPLPMLEDTPRRTTSKSHLIARKASSLTILNDTKGFDRSRADELNGHYELRSMRKRVKHTGRTLTILRFAGVRHSG